MVSVSAAIHRHTQPNGEPGSNERSENPFFRRLSRFVLFSSHWGLVRLAILVFALAPAVSCDDLQIVTNTYATMAEAREEGALAAGWLPPLVPPGAHDIREAHDEGGSRRRWGLFSFAPGDVEPLRRGLGDEMSFGGLRVDAPPRIEWWPVALRGALDADRIAATGLKCYPVTGDELVAAVNWNQRRAYYWSPRSRTVQQ
jgi:hypothetical protein